MIFLVYKTIYLFELECYGENGGQNVSFGRVEVENLKN